MKLEVFTVFDSKVGAFLNPFYLRSVGEVQRAFADAVSDPKSNFNRYPSDYTLFHIGSFDSSTGMIEHLPVFENLGLATQFLPRREVQLQEVSQ